MGGIKQTIINHLDIDIYENDFTVIMGSSGAGKSTLMYSLSGMDTPTRGTVIFNEKDITKMNADELYNECMEIIVKGIFRQN